jgi:hypothetical protein
VRTNSDGHAGNEFVTKAAIAATLLGCMQALDCLGVEALDWLQMVGFSRIDANVLRIANHLDCTDSK